MATSDAPLDIGQVSLTVNDMTKVGDFYQAALGLEKLSDDGTEARFGAHGRSLIALRLDKAAPRHSPRAAGLFHTAFLLPSRADLGAWLHHAAETRIPLHGASDHLVSEALYLADPEGNGIEIYIDRPRDQWRHKGGEIEMATNHLDLQNVADSAADLWRGAPAGTVVGHVHLQVGQLDPAEAFYSGTLGMAVTNHYPGATFYGSDGYHHHLASNIWNSRGAGSKKGPTTGLTEIELRGTAQEIEAIRSRVPAETPLVDPWGTTFTLSRKD
ncbi:VOC family protein [Salipiger mangrovisoli]|uniref:VOC family protein n=1 Tax=Salipiger mangrovisoli TaxID=2865933 RepID=A0ABR9XAK3_9RHOB|nr:VOC family protein [Salipiger mangrovisoli]MBE9640635.1 VOC family protein [Salipiger mangrovisoli]